MTDRCEETSYQPKLLGLAKLNRPHLRFQPIFLKFGKWLPNILGLFFKDIITERALQVEMNQANMLGTQAGAQPFAKIYTSFGHVWQSCTQMLRHFAFGGLVTSQNTQKLDIYESKIFRNLTFQKQILLPSVFKMLST